MIPMEELSLHILDIVENSTRSGARTVTIRIQESTGNDTMTIDIEDNGPGMDEATLDRLRDPFFTTRTVRRVGLGIPLLAQAAEAAGGSLAVTSTPGRGTRVTAIFRLNHIDRQPLGRMDQTMASIIAGNPDIDCVYYHQRDGAAYHFDTRELRRVLETVPLNHSEVISAIQHDIYEGLEKLHAPPSQT